MHSLFRLCGLSAAIVFFAFRSPGTPPPQGVAPVLVPAGGFAIDGDLMADAAGGDWVGNTNAGSGVLSAAGAALNPATTFHFVDPYSSSSDSTFVGGLKWTDDPNTWQWTTSKPSSKTDINNVLLHIANDAGGHTWTIVAADRASTSGDSYIDFEFLQNTLIKTNGGKFISSGPNGGRTVNDLLLSLAFTSGGSVADFLAYRWLPDGSGGYAYQDVTTSLPAGRVFVALNSNTVAVPFGAFGATTYSANAFAEAALDLTALLGGFDPCLSMGFKTIMVKTKSSQSSTSTIGDFIDPIQYSLRIGPSANAGPDQARCTEGASTTFPLNGQASAGLQPVTSTSWSVVSGSATIDAPSSLVTTAHVSSATATLRLTVVQANGCTETDDVVLSVANLPVCSITGAALLCPNSTNVFQAPAGMTGYAWSITGNGVISGATNAQTVKVISGGSCGAAFTLNLVTTSGICSTACSMDVMVADTTPPTMSIPADLVLDCPANTATNATGAATAQDDCGQVTVSYSDAVTSNCAGTKVIARMWTATDHCGNSTNAVQTITVRDITPPTLVLPANLTLECPANTNPTNTGFATSQDGCSAVTVSFNDAVSNSCAGARFIARTWTAVDACGNSTNGTQFITVRDTTRPTLVLPPNITLECPANITTNNTGAAISQDGCGSVTLTFSDSVSNNCGGTSVIKRLWTATDTCGNSTNGVQTITVRDTKAPSLIIPPNLTLECPANTATNNTGSATAQDGCSAVTLTYNDVVTTNCANTKVIARTWTAIDQCGNSTNAVQTITVRDTTPPTLILPPNLTLECPAVTTTNMTGVATAQDGCGSVTLSYSDVVSNNCGGTKVIRRTWVAVDSCGNSTNGVQTITVRDTTPPTLVLPANVVLECPSTNTSTNYTGMATSQDGCGSVVVTYSDTVTTNCGPTKVIARTWTAIDQCGNSTNGVQTITIRDTLKPSLVVPANIVLECPASVATTNTGTATATDGCSKVTLTYSDSVSNSCGGAKVISRLWTAADECGNSTNKVQLITLVDTHPPTITAPPSLVLDCPANTSTNNTGMATAQDGCSSVVISYSDVVSNYCGGTKVITRTWTATDGCGNAASATQTITVRDITPPSLKLPANIVLQCPGDTRTNVTGTAVATDGCGSVTLTYNDVVSNSCGLTRTVQRLWTATDQCGNTTNGLQIISVVDTTKPSIALANISVQCVGDIPPALTNLAAFLAAGGTASDSCSSGLTYSMVSDSGLIGKCPGTVSRVYRVTDACGNFADITNKITVDDTIPPVLTCPTNVTIEYGISLDPTNTGRATATDNCSTNPAIAYSDTQVDSSYDLNFYAADPDTGTGPYSPTYVKLGPASLPCPASALLTGRAQDPLRNAVAFSTNGQLDALTSLGGAPMAMGQIVPFEAVIGMTGGPGPERGTIEFSASWATYTTSNNRFGFDTNYMVYCAFVDSADPGSIDPNNNARVESFSSTLVNAGTINEQIIGTFRVSGIDVGDRIVVEIWMVLDSTQPGNVGGTIASQLVSAQKVLNPPVPITVGSKTISIGNLNKMNPLPPPQQQPPLGPLPQQPPALPGETVSIINRTWTATDDCGNQSSCMQQITVRDTTSPQLNVPANLVLECPADTSTNNTGAATSTDAGGSVRITYSDTVTNTCAGTRVVSRLWTATDLAGNISSATQTITVQDTKAPALIIPPDQTVQCPSDSSTNVCGIATAQEGCSQAVVSYSDATITNSGAVIISRTWTASDSCGNSTNRVQTITVQDTIPPTLTIVPVMQNAAAGSTWSFGTPQASDNCGSVSVSVLNTITNITPTNTMCIARTWLAKDAAGNTNTCCQTMVLQLAAPPAITTSPSGKTFGYGTGGNLTVTAGGPGPLSYQWRFNGTNIAGGTGSSLNLSNPQYTNAGLYDVVVTGAGGSVTSRVAVVNVFPILQSQISGKNITLSWAGSFVLQQAPNLAGPYKDMVTVTNSLLTTMVGPSKFFRLRSQPAFLSLDTGKGTPMINITGSPGENFILQASTDLVHWTSFKTNTLPMQFVDTTAAQYPVRFYRAILAQ
jgi:hypothetical protein